MKKIAVGQMNSKTLDVAYNLDKISGLVNEAASQGAEVIVLPELCASGYRADEAFASIAEPLSGKTVSSLADISRGCGGIYIYTSVAEQNGEGGKPYNTAVLVNGGGALASYRKIHLWGAETEYFSAGSEMCAAQTPLGLTGLMICFDVSFPEAARKHALAGADALFYTFAFANPAREYAFGLLTRARALENGCYVLAANMVGCERGTEFFGASRIIGPAGEELANAGAREGVVCADFDPELLEATRARYPYLAVRRPDTY